MKGLVPLQGKAVIVLEWAENNPGGQCSLATQVTESRHKVHLKKAGRLHPRARSLGPVVW